MNTSKNEITTKIESIFSELKTSQEAREVARRDLMAEAEKRCLGLSTQEHEILAVFRGRLRDEQCELRKSPSLVTSSLTALTHFYGEKLLNDPKRVGAYQALEQDIALALVTQPQVPILFEHQLKLTFDDCADSQTVNGLAFITIDRDQSTACFKATCRSEMELEHAFANSRIPVIHSSLSLVGTTSRAAGKLGEEIHISDTTDELLLARACGATDGPRNSWSEYCYSDSHQEFLYIGGDSCEQASSQYSVGWVAIEHRVRALDANKRLKAIEAIMLLRDQHQYHSSPEDKVAALAEQIMETWR